MSYRGFGPASPYRKGIEFIARTGFEITAGGLNAWPWDPVKVNLMISMLEEMTGRSENSIRDDVHNRLEHLKLEARKEK